MGAVVVSGEMVVRGVLEVVDEGKYREGWVCAAGFAEMGCSGVAKGTGAGAGCLLFASMSNSSKSVAGLAAADLVSKNGFTYELLVACVVAGTGVFVAG